MIELLPPLNSDAALQKGKEIDSLLEQISAHELRLSHSYARLGSLLWQVKVEQYWIPLGFDRFSTYFEHVGNKIGRERSQMYAILSVAEILLPHLTEAQLESIGISKAHELKRLVKQGGNVKGLMPDPNFTYEIGSGEEYGTVQIMDYASDPKVTAAQLRVKVNELLHVHEGPAGLWYELGGFYADAGERKEIEDFWRLGKMSLENQNEQSEHVWKKLVFLDAARECISTWEGELNDVN